MNGILNDEFFSRLETLSLELRANLGGFFGGKHLVRTYGQTVEFADYREYMLGNKAKKDELPYIQLANEISAAYPSIKQIYMGKGAQVDIDSVTVSPCLIVKVQTDTLITTATLAQFKKWIQVRLQVENVIVDNITIEDDDQ